MELRVNAIGGNGRRIALTSGKSTCSSVPEHPFLSISLKKVSVGGGRGSQEKLNATLQNETRVKTGKHETNLNE